MEPHLLGAGGASLVQALLSPSGRRRRERRRTEARCRVRAPNSAPGLGYAPGARVGSHASRSGCPKVTYPDSLWGCDPEPVDSYNKAIILAALGEYALAHPDLVAQVDQAEAEVLALRQPVDERLAPRWNSPGV